MPEQKSEAGKEKVSSDQRSRAYLHKGYVGNDSTIIKKYGGKLGQSAGSATEKNGKTKKRAYKR